MALEKVYLDNFTVFENLEIDFCNGINVLIGENGTGKTHLLKVLYAFCESNTLSKNSKLLFPEMLSQCFFTEQFRTLFHRGQNPLKISIDINEKKYMYQAVVREEISKEAQLKPPLNDLEIALQIDGQRTREEVRTAFIPAKDMLTHAGIEKDYVERYIPFDKTLIDILFKSGMSELREPSPTAREVLNGIKSIIGGTVLFENNTYYIQHEDQEISFQSEAEGFKKLSVLWRLVATGLLEPGTILFWDEPEANINPQYIPALADILYTLQAAGIQIVLATHDYVLAKYLEIKRRSEDSARFHSLYFDDDGVMKAESNPLFKDLKKNSIAEAYNKLLDEVFEQTIRG